MQNPWKQLDHTRATRFGGESATEQVVEHALIDMEYAQVMDSEQCGKCGEIAHYRPSVGSLMCANRHVLAYSGDWR